MTSLAQARLDYESRGFAFAGPVVDATALSCAYDRVIVDGYDGTYAVVVHEAWRREPEFARELPRLAEVAMAVSGLDELVLFQDLLISKPPGYGEMEWHHDYAFWPLDRSDGITMWVTLDDASPENGCMRYKPDIDAPAPSGSAWLHNPLIWHRSAPNRSDRPRRAWSLTWVSPDVRWDPAHSAHPFNTFRNPVAGSPLEVDFPRFRL